MCPRPYADRRAEGVHGEYEAHARTLDARHHAGVADPERRPILTRLSTYPRVRGLVIGAFAETSADVRLLLRKTAEAAAARFWRDAGATSATAAQSVYMSVYRRRWGAEFALQGARMRIARAYLVTGQAEPAPRDPRARWQNLSLSEHDMYGLQFSYLGSAVSLPPLTLWPLTELDKGYA